MRQTKRRIDEKSGKKCTLAYRIILYICCLVRWLKRFPLYCITAAHANSHSIIIIIICKVYILYGIINNTVASAEFFKNFFCPNHPRRGIPTQESAKNIIQTHYKNNNIIQRSALIIIYNNILLYYYVHGDNKITMYAHNNCYNSHNEPTLSHVCANWFFRRVKELQLLFSDHSALCTYYYIK